VVNVLDQYGMERRTVTIIKNGASRRRPLQAVPGRFPVATTLNQWERLEHGCRMLQVSVNGQVIRGDLEQVQLHDGDVVELDTSSALDPFPLPSIG